MITGSKLNAPQGFRGLEKGISYHFLMSDGDINRVRLVFFDAAGTRADLITLTCLEFEAALESGDLVEDGAKDFYPPWLGPTNGVNIAHLEDRRVRPNEGYDAKVNRRYLAIAGLLDRVPEILREEDLEAIINAHAKIQSPQQNAQRLRLWFFSYLVFGQNKWALMPRLHNIGSWDRSEMATPKKLGRPSKAGRSATFPVTEEMKTKILKGFIKLKDPAKTQEEIYGDVLSQKFGCLQLGDVEGVIQFFHPQGRPFPTFHQFWYWVKKQTRPETLTRDLHGPSRARAKSGSQGSFAARLSNLNQLVEFDGFNPSQKISGVTEVV